MTSKKQRYTLLVEKRKRCRMCDGLSNPACRGLAKFDSDEIGPWTRIHGDLKAKLMVVGQDWGDVDYYKKYEGLDAPNNTTNTNLARLLKSIGLDVNLEGPSEARCGVFLTNSILCLKSGGMQSTLEKAWINNCSEKFLRHQIEIVKPKVVVGLGGIAYSSILKLFGFDDIDLRVAINDKQGCVLFGETRLFAAYHCGARTVRINRNMDQQIKDWKRIGRVLRD